MTPPKPDQQTGKESALPEDTTEKLDDAARARQEDYEATVKWNEEKRTNPGTEA